MEEFYKKTKKNIKIYRFLQELFFTLAIGLVITSFCKICDSSGVVFDFAVYRLPLFIGAGLSLIAAAAATMAGKRQIRMKHWIRKHIRIIERERREVLNFNN